MHMGFSLKLGLVCATVLSTAVMFKLLAPFLAVSDLPTIWFALVSWLKPPYLYVLINCIIITIVASTRLQSKLDDSTHPPVKLPLPTDHVAYDGVILTTAAAATAEEPTSVQLEDSGYISAKIVVSEPDLSTPELSEDVRDADEKTAMEAYEEITKNSGRKSVISMSSWTPLKTDLVDLRYSVEKPPASARFGHRKPVKASPEGGRTLRVSKPKKQDTFENTWKTITEGRSMPLARHLRKSDTWETHGQGRHNRDSDDFSGGHSERMTKSETFDGCRKPPARPSTLIRSSDSGKLKKEASLGQEELNRKVEAFIRKFNEDMRLQRQESMNQYMEMINRGAH